MSHKTSKNSLPTKKATLSKITLGAAGVALLLTTALPSLAKETPIIELSPKSKWTATMIDGATADDGYCALARQYNQNVVLSFGQSTKDEYSLAIDFQEEKLKMEKAYSIKLQPAPGKLRAYEMMPASPQALVVRLGYDEDFFNALQKSGQLKADIDGKNYQFAMQELSTGRDELRKCMAGLKGEGVVQTASNFSAQKVDNGVVAEMEKKAEAVVKKAEAVKAEAVKAAPKKLEIPKAELAKSEIKKAEPVKLAVQEAKKEVPKKLSIPAPEKLATMKKAADDKPVALKKIDAPEAIVTPPPIIVPAAKVEEKKVVKPIEMARVESKIKEVKPEPKKLEPVKIKPTKVEPPKVEAPKVVVKKEEVKQEPKVATINTNRVSKDVDLNSSVWGRPDAVSAAGKRYGSFAEEKPKLEMPKAVAQAKPEVKKAEIKKPEVKTAMVEEMPKPMPAPTVKATPLKKTETPKPKMAEVSADAFPEDKFPKPFSKSVAKDNVSISKNEAKLKTPRAPEPEVEPKPQAEKEPEKESVNIVFNKDQKVAKETAKKLSDARDRIAADMENQEKKLAKVDTQSPQAQAELKEIRKELADLEKENRALYMEARNARSQIDATFVDTSNEALKRIRAYEKKLEASQSDNLSLAKEIEELRRVQEDTQLSALSGDPKMQQSLKRYNEAQREIKRLGLLLEQQKLSHRQEKTELEQMLFDPAVTDNAQRKKLANLENKLAQAEQRLTEESQKVNVVDEKTQARLTKLEQELAQAKNKEQALRAEEQRVQMEAKKVAAAEAKLNALSQKELALKEREVRLKAEAAKISSAKALMVQQEQREQQLKALADKRKLEALEEAKKIAAAEERLAQARLKEQALKQQEQQLAAAQSKLEAARLKEQQVKAAEAALQTQTQALQTAQKTMAQANAKMAALQQKEQQLAQAQKQLADQSQRLAAYSNERVTPSAGFTPSVPAVAAQPLRQAAPVRQAAPRAAASPVVQTSNFNQGVIQQILAQSGLSDARVAKQRSGLYSWNSQGVNGRAEVATNGQNLNQFVQGYIAREKQKCAGDFASLPATAPNGRQAYEIACISGNGGKSASAVFAQKGGSVIAIVHETSADNMDAAIDARDKVARNL